MNRLKAWITFITTDTAHQSSFESTKGLHTQTLPCSHDPAAWNRVTEWVQLVAVMPVVEEALIAHLWFW